MSKTTRYPGSMFSEFHHHQVSWRAPHLIWTPSHCCCFLYQRPCKTETKPKKMLKVCPNSKDPTHGWVASCSPRALKTTPKRGTLAPPILSLFVVFDFKMPDTNNVEGRLKTLCIASSPHVGCELILTMPGATGRPDRVFSRKV